MRFLLFFYIQTYISIILVPASSNAFLSSSSLSLSQKLIIRYASDDNTNNDANDMLNGGELVSALARIDKEWNEDQNDPRSEKKSRWTKLVIEKEEEDVMGSMNADGSVVMSQLLQEQQDYCYLLEPPNSSIPSCLICFVGGAGLGQFPHIAYNEVLTRVSNQLNAAILTAPYSVALNHWELSKRTGEILRKAQLQCEDERQYPTTLKTYSLSHSLGCKLSTLYMAATDRDYDGVGFISFNNFDFSETIRLVREFAQQMGGKSSSSSSSMPFDQDAMLSQLFSFAETAVGALGVDFTPNSSELKQVLEMKYASQGNAKKTRLFIMDDDNLDTSQDVLDAVGRGVVSVSKLPGTHLSPVFLKLSLDDVLSEVETDVGGPDVRDLLNQSGYQNASFGDEKDLDVLVQEVVDFVMGKSPSSSSSYSRRPSLLNSDTNDRD